MDAWICKPHVPHGVGDNFVGVLVEPSLELHDFNEERSLVFRLVVMAPKCH